MSHVRIGRQLRATTLALVAGVAVAFAGCGSSGAGADRVGNPPEVVTVTVGTEEHPNSVTGTLLVEFADDVALRSDGAVEVDITFGIGGGGVAWDQRAIERAADGDFDLVVARAGAWNAHGVTTLDVLQLPGVVDTDEQADRLIGDHELVDRLLAGLEPAGFTGLLLVPEAPRYLMLLDGSERFDTDALRGRTIRTPLNDTVFAVLRAAGMAPVDLSAGDFLVEVSDGAVTMTEGQLSRVELTTTTAGRSDAAVAANLPIYTKFLVLAARSDSVDADTLALLRESAGAIVDPFIATRLAEVDATAAACRAGGTLVRVPADQRAAFLSAVQPVVEEFEAGPDGELLRLVRAAAGPTAVLSWACAPEASTTASTLVEPAGLPVELPTQRGDIVPTPGDLPDGVYRFTQTDESLVAAGAPAADEPFIGDFVLRGGTAELHYFELDGSPMAGEPPDTGGVYQVEGDLMIFATPPERAFPGTTGIYLLRWSLDGDTLTLDQLDDGRRDADFAVPWVRVGEAP